MKTLPKIILITILVLFHIKLFSQLYFGPSLGMDMSQISTDPQLSPLFEIKSCILSCSSISYGVLLEQTLSHKAIIALRTSMTKKQAHPTTSGIAAIDKIDFYHLKNSLELKYFPHKAWDIGVGINVNSGFNQRISYSSTYGRKNNFTESGLLLSSGLNFDKFLVDLIYSHSLSINYNEKSLYQIQPTKSIMISMSYLFKIKDTSKSSDYKCPRI